MYFSHCVSSKEDACRSIFKAFQGTLLNAMCVMAAVCVEEHTKQVAFRKWCQPFHYKEMSRRAQSNAENFFS